MARKKSRNRSGSNMPGWAKTLIGGAAAVAYGYVRPKMAAAVPALHPKIAGYSDEILFGGSALVLSLIPMGKAGKYVRLATKPIMHSELEKVGEKMQIGVTLSGQ